MSLCGHVLHGLAVRCSFKLVTTAGECVLTERGKKKGPTVRRTMLDNRFMHRHNSIVSTRSVFYTYELMSTFETGYGVRLGISNENKGDKPQ